MAVAQADKIVDHAWLYTVLQIEPDNDAPIIFPPGENKLMVVLRNLAPEYFTEKHYFRSNKWKSSVNDVQSEIMQAHCEVGVYSSLDVRVFTERLEPQEAIKRNNAGANGVLGWRDLRGESLAQDAVKTLVIEHLLGGYKNPKFNDSGEMISFLRDCAMPNLTQSGTMGGFCDAAYETALTAILTRKSVEDITGRYRPFESHVNRTITVRVDDPTAERAEKAAGEFRKFLDYVAGKKEGIVLIAAQVYNALREGETFTGLGNRSNTEAERARLKAFAGEAFHNASRDIDLQIAALPAPDCALMQYLYF